MVRGLCAGRAGCPARTGGGPVFWTAAGSAAPRRFGLARSDRRSQPQRRRTQEWWGERTREPERGCVEDQPQRLRSKPNAGVSGQRAAAGAAHTAALLQRHRTREPEGFPMTPWPRLVGSLAPPRKPARGYARLTGATVVQAEQFSARAKDRLSGPARRRGTQPRLALLWADMVILRASGRTKRCVRCHGPVHRHDIYE